MANNNRDEIFFPVFVISIFVLILNVYWFSYSFFEALGWTYSSVVDFLNIFERAGFFSSPYKLKLVCLLCIFMMTVTRPGKRTEAPWWTVIVAIVLASALYLFSPASAEAFLVLSIVGYIVCFIAYAFLGRKLIRLAKPVDNDALESFDQMRKKVRSKFSLHLRTEFKYKGRMHKGWVNIVNVFRGILVLGTPGSGKTYSIIWSMIEQMIDKKFTMFVYDFKMPDLTKIVYNNYLKKYPKQVVPDPENPKKTIPNPKIPQFCLINFKDLRQSMRCNPLNARYLTDQSDAHEVADLIMKNVNPNSIESEDFFVQSARVYLAAMVWLLKKYNHGACCSFPHLIELMGQKYEAVFEIMKQDRELCSMIAVFADAMDDNAMEQLQGQVASARMPLLRFTSSSLYWVLTGDDFSLDLNNPDEPKILCVGNDPDRQATYGASLALITSRLVKVINHKVNAKGKKNLPIGVILDEFPTVFIKGIDNLVATARSNRVAVFLGAQDKSQIVRDYKRDNADVVFNTVGNIFSGQVNGETAKYMSESFGREFRLQESSTLNADGGSSISASYQQHEILPQSKIETLSNGYFFGKVADDRGAIMDKKLFCGKILVDVKKRDEEEKVWKDVPNFGEQKYFNFKKVHERTRENMDTEIRLYIKEQLKEEERIRQRVEIGSPAISDYVIDLEAKHRYDTLTEEDRKEIENKVIRKREDEYIQEVVERNNDQIATDIVELFAHYGIDIKNYKSKRNAPSFSSPLANLPNDPI